jgi:hypothetical protein
MRTKEVGGSPIEQQYSDNPEMRRDSKMMFSKGIFRSGREVVFFIAVASLSFCSSNAI